MNQTASTLDPGTYEGHLPGQHFNMWNWVRAQLDKASYRPQSVPGIVVRRLDEDNTTYYVLKNPKLGTYLKLSDQDYVLWDLMDGSRTVKDLVVAYFERYKAFAFGRVTVLVDELRSAGFLTDQPVGVYRQSTEQLTEREWSHRGQQLAHAFMEKEFYFEGVDRYVTFAYRYGGRIFFFKPVLGLLALLALIGAVAFALLFRDGTYTILAPVDSSVLGYVGGLLTLLLINMVMIFVHESGHALTTKHFGREVRRGGVMIYYGMPAFFVDTIDIWLEPKKRRIAVSWAGPHAELITAGICSLLALWIGDSNSTLGSLFFKAAFLGYLSLLINLNPLLELDGYFILSDWLGMPMLRQRSFVFIREALPGKMSAWLRPRWHALLPGDRVSKPSGETQGLTTFIRDEIIYTVFGVLAALYTVYALWLAVFFWQTHISKVLLDVWNEDPALLFKPLVALVVTLLIIPVALAVATTLWRGRQRLVDWLERRHFFEREGNVAIVVTAGLVLIWLAPVLVGGTTQQAALTAASILLAGLAVGTLILTARQYAGAEFQRTFWGLALAAALLLVGTLLSGLYPVVARGGLGELVLDTAVLFEQLVAIGLLVAGVGSLVGVDLRRGPAWERAAMLGLLALGFAAVLPIARWTAGWRLVETIPAVASVNSTLVFLALIIPTLTAYARTRFFIPWLTLVLGAGVLGTLNLLRTAPGWIPGSTVDSWLVLAVAALWGIGGLLHAAAGSRLHFASPHWSQDVTYSEEERLRLAFARFFEALFDGFRLTFGARRAQDVDDELDLISVAADWDVEIDAGRVRDELDLSEISIVQQADRYREVLSKTIDLIDDWAGNTFTARMAQAGYDSLPWPDRETLGRYVLAGTPWGGAIADHFASTRSERARLLRAVPFFAGMSSRDYNVLQAALEHKEVACGRFLARRGAPIRRFVLIQSGKVEVWQPDSANGNERLAGELRRGGTFGSEVFIGERTHEATYRAASDTQILTISADEARRLRQVGVEIDTHVVIALSTIQMLSQMPIFASLSPQQIGVLTRCMRPVTVDARQIIVRQGEPRRDFFVIVEGQVRVLVRDGAGEDTMVAHLGRGEHFGETSLYIDQPYAATCQAETPVNLLALDEPTFDELVASSQQVAHYVEQVSTGRALDTRRKLGLAGLVS
jgi:putative peptide zinc metalloprotease protein